MPSCVVCSWWFMVLLFWTWRGCVSVAHKEEDALLLEMHQNRSIFQRKFQEGMMHPKDCVQFEHSDPTIMFVCLYAVHQDTWTHGGTHGNSEPIMEEFFEENHTKRRILQPNDYNSNNSPVKIETWDSESSVVHCIHSENNQKAQKPLETVYCCQNSQQNCTYFENDRSHIQVNCQSSSGDSTLEIMNCCQKSGFHGAVTEPDAKPRVKRMCY